MSNKKVIKVRKSQKHTFFHSKLILSTFLWKGIFFDSTRAELLLLRLIWYRCSNMCLVTCKTSLLVWRGVYDIFTMLNYFSHLTSFKEIGSLIENTHKKHHFYCVADTIKLMFLFCAFSIKDPICLKLVRCFCCYSASIKTSFGFCSCSEPLQLKFGQN